MLKMKIRRRVAEAAQAVTQLAEIRTSITALNDEDLLDLADIFSAEIRTSIGNNASMELKRRNLSV